MGEKSAGASLPDRGLADASFEVGQTVAFNHDEIAYAETPVALFAVPYNSLTELVEADFKKSR